MRLPGLLPLSILMLAGILTALLPLLREINFGTIKEWQVLIGFSGTVVAGWVAWLNVSRQVKIQRNAMRMNLLSREEDRMEAALPLLREAGFAVFHLSRSMKRCKTAHEVDALVKDEGWLPSQGERMSDVVRRKVPKLDELTLRHVAGEVVRIVRAYNLVMSSARNLRLRQSEFNAALAAVTPTGEVVPEIEIARERYKEAEAKTDEAIHLFIELSEGIGALSQRLEVRAQLFERKLVSARQEIEAYFQDI